MSLKMRRVNKNGK